MAAPESIRQNGMKQQQQVIPFREEQRKNVSSVLQEGSSLAIVLCNHQLIRTGKYQVR
jgi:hypothetical protein